MVTKYLTCSMVRFKMLLYIFLLVGCTSSIPEKSLPYLNGYWEITEVTFANGEKKNYTVNTSVDFIALEEMKGFKKKVRPKLDGSYTTSDDAEPFTIIQQGDTYILRYKNNLSTWEEQITVLNENNYVVVNQDNITYHYKRFEPLKIAP
ncbi:lipocalin family protein [Croceitalea sp. MTPC5]|nr:lipocalin family protein [Croceitalea sp. MTPC5]